MPWALAHGQLGGSGGMLPQKIWKFRHSEKSAYQLSAYSLRMVDG